MNLIATWCLLFRIGSDYGFLHGGGLLRGNESKPRKGYGNGRYC